MGEGSCSQQGALVNAADLFKRARDWWQDQVIPGWLVSLVVHTIFLFVMMTLTISPKPKPAEASLESQLTEIPEDIPLEEIPLEPMPLEPPEMPEVEQPDTPATSAVAPTAPEVAPPAPLAPVDLPPLDNIAAALEGPGPSGLAAKGPGSTFAGRGEGLRRAMLGSQGGTKFTEIAVQAGLDWLVRHQYPDGHWSLDHRRRCRGEACPGAGNVRSDMAATALGVLPFLAANYTHRSGPHRAVVGRALTWILQHQQPNGLFQVKGHAQPMYTHGLATIAVSEAYALTRDPRLGAAAQKAINFLASVQNALGGWRYSPNSQDADTSVVGWQAMGIKSGQMGGLQVPARTLLGIQRYLQAASSGEHGGLFGYTPGSRPTPSMTAVGLLCLQYFGARRSDPAIVEGIDYLMKNLPNPQSQRRDSYYWYYATQVVHNFQGPQWDRWNRLMRRIWVRTQNRDRKSCQFGSWDPSNDRWGDAGGRHFVTTVGLLTLEVYYRYLPLYGVMEEEPERPSPGEQARKDAEEPDKDGGTDAGRKNARKRKNSR